MKRTHAMHVYSPSPPFFALHRISMHRTRTQVQSFTKRLVLGWEKWAWVFRGGWPVRATLGQHCHLFTQRPWTELSKIVCPRLRDSASDCGASSWNTFWPLDILAYNTCYVISLNLYSCLHIHIAQSFIRLPSERSSHHMLKTSLSEPDWNKVYGAFKIARGWKFIYPVTSSRTPCSSTHVSQRWRRRIFRTYTGCCIKSMCSALQGEPTGFSRCTDMREKVKAWLRQLAPRCQREQGGGIHTT